MTEQSVAAIVIGRNEGNRLIRCLASLGEVTHIVYVDSGSTDGSVAAAIAAGAEVVELDLAQPFTAARARNAGIAALRQGNTPQFVQFIDGDCELQPDWLPEALAFLSGRPKAAVVCGRRRERFPEASVYNRLCDREWDTPVGKAKACGGDSLMRMTALDRVKGFNPSLIAGEEPELCVRIRAKGWEVWRLDAEMTLHDAAITKLSQWWKRARRSGHAAAEGMAMHGRPPERHGVATVRRAVFWALALPLAIVLAAAVIGPWALILLAAYPIQVARLAWRNGGQRVDWEEAFFLTFGKFPEMFGIAEYWLRRATGKASVLIEYK